MTPAILLRMGRVSNLPTVWTNVMAAMVLAGARPSISVIAAMALAASLLYVAGMVLNDVYDVETDRRERPERPIPANLVGRSEAARYGYGLLIAGVAVAAATGWVSGGGNPWPGIGAAVTAILIVIYDLRHKGNPLAPLIMGLCRVGVYAMAGAFAAPRIDANLWAAAGILCGYVLGLTYVARFENSGTVGRAWPRILLALPLVWGALHLRTPMAAAVAGASAVWLARSLDLVRRGGPIHTRQAVVSLIAGIALVDAGFLAALHRADLALAALAAFGLTLGLQRYVAGT